MEAIRARAGVNPALVWSLHFFFYLV
jgi:hypothetical protein